MRLLVVGGTRFIGKHVVGVALSRGHDVTVFHRGRSGAPPDGVRSVLGDRDQDLSAVSGSWDAVIDTSAYHPEQVSRLASAVRTDRYLYVSSVSAYAPPPQPGYSEDAPLTRGEDYGGRKAAGESVAVDTFGAASTVIVRPTFVVGPDDYTWRFPWWVARLARGGRVLAPEPKDAPAQLIDVRDLTDWMVRLVEDGRSGAFHAVSPAPPWSWDDQLEGIRDAVAAPGTELVWVDLAGEEVTDTELPLWVGGEPEAGFMLAADPARAYATGLTPRPFADTVRDTLDWIRRAEQPPEVGLSPQRERELLGRYAPDVTA